VHWTLLESLTEEERRQVLAAARRRTFTRNEVIFHEGDTGDTLHLVAQGHVALRIHTPLGDVATMRIVRPGEFFGELAAVSPAARNASAIALEGAETLVLDADSLARLRAAHRGVDELLIIALATEVRRLARQLVDAMYVPVEARVWRRVVELVSVYGQDGEPARVIPVTQEVLAQLVGCARPTANRVLRAGEQQGAVRVTRGQIEIRDTVMLERLAS